MTPAQREFIEKHGDGYTIAELCEMFDLPYSQVYQSRSFGKIEKPPAKEFKRPPCVYTNIPSFFKIADELHGLKTIGHRDQNGLNTSYRL